MKAWLNLRHGVPERAEAWRTGLETLGFHVIEGMTTRPDRRDILVTWNIIREAGPVANAFESRGNLVVVTENATWGNDFAGQRWYTVARDRHNTAGKFPVGGPERWDRLGVDLAPWRTGGDTLILPQRGIGPQGTAMPAFWEDRVRKRYPGARLRPHPGRNQNPKTLEADLRGAGRVVTWGSGAAVQALSLGVPVDSEMPNWIAAQDNSTPGRLAMFRRLAWAQWTLHEISQGEPVARLLDRSV